MGIRMTFTCPSCDYSAVVSGRLDMGLYVDTVTISCKSCRQLRDTLATERSGDKKNVSVSDTFFGHRMLPNCPESQRHKVELWTHPGPCPQCGMIMEKGGEGIEFWD